MERFKKRTTILLFASVITIAGVFANGNYKNSLMGLTFDKTTEENIGVIVQTKYLYNDNVNLIRRDLNTYLFTLPDMDSKINKANISNVSSFISSVEIRSIPSSGSSKGYVRVTIKTSSPSLKLNAKTQVFSGELENHYSNSRAQLENRTNRYDNGEYYDNSEVKELENQKEEFVEEYSERNDINNSKEDFVNSVQKPVSNTVKKSKSVVTETPVNEKVSSTSQNNSDSDYLYYILWIILIIIGSSYFIVRASNKMQEVAGEKFNINDDEEKQTQKTKLKKINNTIKKLDSTYSKTATSFVKNNYDVQQIPTPIKTVKPSEELNIVDLDELFKEQQAKSVDENDDENSALEDFLSGFSFMEEEEIKEQELDSGFDEEFYEKVIANENIRFTNDDIICINKLLELEISDEILSNLDFYLQSEPVKEKISKDKMVENLIAEYAISQNIIFKQEDVKTLHELMSVELSEDFVTDLKVDPELKTKMEQEILSFGDKPKKPSDIVILNVKDVLPDLSIEINKKDAFAYKPVEREEYDDSCLVGAGELKISSELPNLQDVLTHPEKYEKKEVKEEVDEDSLLKNIENVTFKPFYEEEDVVIDNFANEKEIQQEFNQFENFEIIQDDIIETQVVSNDLIEQEIVLDLDKFEDKKVELESKTIQQQNTEMNQETALVIQENKTEEFVETNKPQTAKDLIEKIEQIKMVREKQKTEFSNRIEVKSQSVSDTDLADSVGIDVTRCIIDNKTYNIVSSVEILTDKGFHLAKSADDYMVLGFDGGKLTKIKQYDLLKSNVIHARLSEKLPSGTLRYLVRIGLKKFIVNVNENSFEYVMDLC